MGGRGSSSGGGIDIPDDPDDGGDPPPAVADPANHLPTLSGLGESTPS